MGGSSAKPEPETGLTKHRRLLTGEINNDWKPLSCPCPATECTDVETIRHWHHANCNERMQINSQAFIRCAEHTNPFSLLEARWSCGKHVGEFRPTNVSGLAHAMMIAMSMYQTNEEKLWAKQLLKSVSLLSG